ncbi:hypothetical protein ACWC4J_06605 [Streptomyces sp. NPDC001356]
MTSKHTPVDGPFRITVEPIPTGVTLDVEPFVQHIVEDVVRALLTDDVYADRLAELYDAQPKDPYAVERAGDLRGESLVADLVAIVSTRLPVYGLQALRLAGRIEQLAAPAVAGLQAAEGGAAA